MSGVRERYRGSFWAVVNPGGETCPEIGGLNPEAKERVSLNHQLLAQDSYAAEEPVIEAITQHPQY
jgi:hypothetical protein